MIAARVARQRRFREYLVQPAQKIFVRKITSQTTAPAAAVPAIQATRAIPRCRLRPASGAQLRHCAKCEVFGANSRPTGRARPALAAKLPAAHKMHHLKSRPPARQLPEPAHYCRCPTESEHA